MKFYETHYEEYLNKKINLHPKLEKIYNKFPKKVGDLKNLIFYGPPGIGKYTQTLKSIQQYSLSDLKYEKKISILFNKQNFFFKISDIHYEIDLSLLGCNSKLLFHDIYLQIIDIISTKIEKIGIIICKNFHEINNELLDNFYSYMQQNSYGILLKFILITEKISFITDNILNCCEIIHVSRPSKTTYNKCLIKKLSNISLENINNIKHLYDNASALNISHKIICNKIIYSIINIDELNFIKFRDLIYDIFIYNLVITECIWYIISVLITDKKIKEENISKLLIKTYNFFQYYNNNYRPIYHLEHYFYFIVSIIHNY